MASTKVLLNDPSNAVSEMIDGLVINNPGLQKLENYNVVVRTDFQEYAQSGKVALISGGGSGHEPAHGGFVGKGMLTAAVAGGVFASPSVESILAAILTVTGSAGCLLIVKNYTGDRLNFGLAAEEAKAKGLKVEVVFVAEDCALEPEKGITGRRGLAGTCFVHKIVGACAEAGSSLTEVTNIAKDVCSRIGTMGVALSVCTVPGKPKSTRLTEFDGNIELGLGIHGEPGMQIEPITTVDDIMSKLAKPILQPRKSEFVYLPIKKGSPIAVLVNNLGGTTGLEINVAVRAAFNILTSAPYELNVVRIFSGPLMTSLEMSGISLTILNLSNMDDYVKHLDLNTMAPGWPNFQGEVNVKPIPHSNISMSQSTIAEQLSNNSAIVVSIKTAIKSCVQVLNEKEPELTAFDTKCGDGDCGETFKMAANALLKMHEDSRMNFSTPKSLINSIAVSVGRMGGTSGAILTIFFRALEAELGKLEADSVEVCSFDTINRTHWAIALKAGVTAISYYGGAQPGMRTMLDTFWEFNEAMQRGDNAQQIVSRSLEAAKSTATMSASAGRSNYVPDEMLQGIPDPGAMAIAYVIEVLIPQIME